MRRGTSRTIGNAKREHRSRSPVFTWKRSTALRSKRAFATNRGTATFRSFSRFESIGYGETSRGEKSSLRSIVRTSSPLFARSFCFNAMHINLFRYPARTHATSSRMLLSFVLPLVLLPPARDRLKVSVIILDGTKTDESKRISRDERYNHGQRSRENRISSRV